MGIVDDLLKALDRVPIWKRLGEIPGEVDDLRSRVSQLEEKHGGKYPPEVCRFCGARAARLKSVLGPDGKGMLHETWVCSECDGYDKKLTKGR